MRRTLLAPRRNFRRRFRRRRGGLGREDVQEDPRREPGGRGRLLLADVRPVHHDGAGVQGRGEGAPRRQVHQGRRPALVRRRADPLDADVPLLPAGQAREPVLGGVGAAAQDVRAAAGEEGGGHEHRGVARRHRGLLPAARPVEARQGAPPARPPARSSAPPASPPAISASPPALPPPRWTRSTRSTRRTSSCRSSRRSTARRPSSRRRRSRSRRAAATAAAPRRARASTSARWTSRT